MKKIAGFIFSFLLLFLIATPIYAEEINNFSSNISINQSGTILVEESIMYDFGSENRHGIFREIPLVKTNSEGKKFILDISNISVADEKEKEYIYQTINTGSSLTIKIGDPDRTISGVHLYKIRYLVSGALTYFSDHDELYWNVTGNSWQIPIQNVSSTIILPQQIQNEDFRVGCYTGVTGSTEEDCIKKIQNDRVIVESAHLFGAYEGLTVVAGFPKGLVGQLEPREYKTFFETIGGKIALVAIGILAIFWYLFYPIWILIKWWMTGRDPVVGGPVAAWYDPPTNSKGRKLLPAEVGTLIDETVNIKDISATIVDLARRGYMKIEERKKNDFYLVRTNPKSNSDNLFSYEMLLYEALFSPSNFLRTLDAFKNTNTIVKSISQSFLFTNGKLSLVNKTSNNDAKKELDNMLQKFEMQEVRLKNLNLINSVKEIEKILYDAVVNEGFFDKNPNSTRTYYSVVGGIALFTLNIQLALIAFVVGRNMPKKTILGARQAMVARSLKNFLKGQERQLTFQAKNQMWFEKLLPYAVAFGVEKYWAEQFKDIAMTAPSWYSTYDNRPFNSLYLTSHLGSSFSSISIAVTPTSSSSGFGSGFSGGSSGGGGGGGGGGSW